MQSFYRQDQVFSLFAVTPKETVVGECLFGLDWKTESRSISIFKLYSEAECHALASIVSSCMNRV